MSLLVSLVGTAVKAISAARSSSRAAGHEAPALDELHSGLTPVRSELMQERVKEAATNSSGEQDAPGDGGGFFSDVIDWFANL
jgi:hypothetical protein